MIPNRDTIEQKQLGWVELITGCMFAGKTEEFIKRLRRHAFAKRNVIAFKPVIDTRYAVNEVASHAGTLLPSIPVNSTAELKEKLEAKILEKKVDVVGIDEIQFFDEAIVDYIEELADRGIIVIVTGLDKDFRSQPFKNVDRILPLAEMVDKLTAICQKCGNFANRTQRIIDGKPADWNSPLILVDGNDSYEARCRNCYQIEKG
ncbi:thymidine, deoxyuridine kinase [Mesoplasma florum L1]|uniref:Thymidine kinase n=2 Tax=Mesoplasma florum TaxID=2151 RepID=KITH_MESFL|nr:thymidine kinase [Mesoplasma florum]Q6F0I2.1 RecName: Full=Thymidine kinase [Mesoplasma florum L1]AAT75991.1 thymidine, deoxyuridine kinase [Mesoplasma florum L1]AGY41744.1 Thymidine kinase [Mesoplasma florum W37]ATI73591.1 thymidine kinase [Mesoplasma florum]ATI74281.1 thymidine kinase [Mesoplasma florum]AVN59949.1 thymidine kinase [Mesoplasma florum]